MEKPNIDLESVVRELQELIQCPVCLGCLDDSVVLCQNGHGVCGECRSKLSQCPTCKAGFLQYRATLLCQLMDKISKPCPFADKGCSEIMVTGDHKSFCQWRPVRCETRYSSWHCPWSGCLRDLVDHEKTTHSFFDFEELGYKKYHTVSLLKNSIFCEPRIFKTNLFFLWIYRDSRSERIMFRFYHVPTSKPTEVYYLTVSFKKGNIEFTYTVKACDEMKDVDSEPRANESGLTIPDELIDMFLDENITNEYSITEQLQFIVR